VTTGSDSGYIYKLYGFDYVRELELLREAGFHPADRRRDQGEGGEAGALPAGPGAAPAARGAACRAARVTPRVSIFQMLLSFVRMSGERLAVEAFYREPDIVMISSVLATSGSSFALTRTLRW
jgi:hypothetical protein